MALRDLVDGDCGRVNSLVHLTSHFVQDRSHKEDGLRHQAPYEDTFTNADADQLVQEFLSETLFRPPQTFRMDSLLQEMREMESAASQHAPIQAPGVAASLASNDTEWTQEFLESRRQLDEGTEEDVWNSLQERPLNEPIEGLEFKELLDGDNALMQSGTMGGRPYSFMDTRPLLMPTPGMNFYRQHLGFENVANLVDISDLDSTDGVEEVWNDAIADNLGNTEAIFLPSEESSAVKDQETIPNKESLLDDQGVFSSDLWVKLTESWQKLLNPNDPSWGSDLSDYNDPYKEYPFESENPMKDHPNALEEGKRRLEEGDLAGAVLCFEAAVKIDSKSSEAWQLLGMSQAENEQDPQAIAALKNCISLDPGNLKALMAIAISYTNENYPYHAFLHLKEWLRHNPHYSSLVPKSEESESPRILPTFLTGDIRKEVQDLYIAAARLHPKEDIDPDVQCGLGVLFNLSREYDKAVDCFKTALQVRQDDSRIWNRLGATLANGDRSEEAVEAYHRALTLAPGYVRARYNVGITCLNLSAYKEAVEHFLIALNQQAQAKGIDGAGRSSMSDSIWGTLRLVMSLTNRPDLYEAVDNRDLATLNKEYGVDLKRTTGVPSS